mmetsp:Transcript_75980/g.68125  ORF Transcript_75980/g.68125 Transcript_75980/m.68125 type:complete len:124 (-) Transcript_75980:99-470(-)
MNRIILVVVAIAALTIAAWSADCTCDIGVYLKDVNGKCQGEIKKIQIADVPENCVQVYSSPALYIDISECTSSNVTVGLFPNAKCTIAVKKESIPCGGCSQITDPSNNITFALSPTCGDSIFI